MLVDEDQSFVCECDSNGPGIQNAMGYECTERGGKVLLSPRG